MIFSSPFPDFGSRSRERPSPPRPRFTSGFGTVLQEERQLHSAIDSGIKCAEGLRAQKLIVILRQHAARVVGIASSLEIRYQTLPAPARFLALGAARASIFRLSRSSRLPHADPLVRLTEQHELLIRRFESITARDTVRHPPDIFSDAIHQHREMVWRLGNLLHARDDDTARGGIHAGDALDP